MRLALGTTINPQVVGLPPWARGADYWQDFTAPKGNLPAVTDTHSGTIYELNSSGIYMPAVANALVRNDRGLETTPTVTNLFATSSMGNGADSTVSASLIASPISGQTAMSLVEDGATTDHYGSRLTSTLVANTIYSWSCIAKANGRTKFYMQPYTLSYAASPYVGYDLSNGTIFDSGAFGGAVLTNSSITALGNGWYFCQLAGKIDTTSTGCDCRFYPQNPGNVYAGSNGLRAFDFANLQCELGSFSTPPIITTGATVTINGNQQVANLAAPSGADIAFQVDVKALHDGDWLWQDNDGTVNNRAGIRQNAGQFQFLVDAGGVNQAALNLGAVATGVQKFAASYATNYAMAQIVGGTPSVAVTTVTLPAITKMNLGGNGFNASNNGYAVTKKTARALKVQNAVTFAAALARATSMS